MFNAADDGDGPHLIENASTAKSELIMFHVVFVMGPPPLGRAHRVRGVCGDIVKKFSRALKWVQVHHDYVWQQTDALLMKRQQLQAETNRSRATIISDLLESSSLATAMMTLQCNLSVKNCISILGPRCLYLIANSTGHVDFIPSFSH